MRGGHAKDQPLFGVAHGLEPLVKIFEEDLGFLGVLVEDDVFIGAQTVKQVIAAGSGFAGGGSGAGGFRGVTAIGVDSRLGCFGFLLSIGHIGDGGRVARDSTLRVGAAGSGAGWQAGQVIEIRGEVFCGSAATALHRSCRKDSRGSYPGGMPRPCARTLMS